MGGAGLTEATKMAILNANYIKSALEPYYPILYTGSKGWCAHEMIVDCNGIAKETGINAIDIAKRLMDYGFHAPTVAFPVHGTLMVEPITFACMFKNVVEPNCPRHEKCFVGDRVHMRGKCE